MIDSFKKNPYYSGVMFEVVVPDRMQPVVTGGRYDTLLTQVGLAYPSIGFAIQCPVL